MVVALHVGDCFTWVCMLVRRLCLAEQELSPLAYLRSGRWARSLACVTVLYVAVISLLVFMVKQLPTRGALADKAHLPADSELLMKLVRPIVLPQQQSVDCNGRMLTECHLVAAAQRG